MVAEPCYKALEEQIIKTKVVRETVFQILGVLIKKYNHGTSCLIKLVQVNNFISIFRPYTIIAHKYVPYCTYIRPFILYLQTSQ